MTNQASLSTDELSTLLRQVAEGAGLNWTNVARICGLSKVTVSRLMRGKISDKKMASPIYVAAARRLRQLLDEHAKRNLFDDLHELSRNEKTDALIGVLCHRVQ